jgi:glutamate dehydrogenase/leucine dehydrogenase
MMTVEELLAQFEKFNITFAFAARTSEEDGELIVSHRELDSLRELILQSPDFANHEAVFVGRDARFKTLFFAFVHNTTRGLSQGGLRVMEYPTASAVLNDGLRLSQGMSRKNAVSDLWWGGGKGIIPVTGELIEKTFDGDHKMRNRSQRDALFGAYGEFVAKLGGVYYTAADIGTTNRDMQAILAANRFVTSLPPHLGGSGDPSSHTAEGVFQAIKTARKHLTGNSDLSEIFVAVQGAGKVGQPLIEKLLSANAKVFASEAGFETDKAMLKNFQDKFPTVRIVPCGGGHENDILAMDADIIAPCAVGGVINNRTIPLLKPSVKIICGGANNILGNEISDGESLYQKGIVFIPDFVCNWMGIVNSANEAFGYLEEDVLIALERLPETVSAVLDKAKSKNISHTTAAHLIADEKLKEMPPDALRQNRGRRIIARLIGNHQLSSAAEPDAAKVA